jgi:hypothetical protein
MLLMPPRLLPLLLLLLLPPLLGISTRFTCFHQRLAVESSPRLTEAEAEAEAEEEEEKEEEEEIGLLSRETRVSMC